MSTRITFCCTSIVVIFSASLFAKPVPDNLGGGLDKILENHLIQQGVITTAPATSRVMAPTSQSVTTSITKSSRGSRKQTAAGTTTTSTVDFASYKSIIAQQANSYASRAITDPATGNYVVMIVPNGRVSVTNLEATLKAAHPAMVVRAVDQRYAGHGAIEANV